MKGRAEAGVALAKAFVEIDKHMSKTGWRTPVIDDGPIHTNLFGD